MSPEPMPSDEALYERLSSGDIEAFDRLYERYEQPLFGFVLEHVDDRQEAEDVLQEAFLGVLRDHRSDRGRGSFRAWLFQVARHLCLNRARSAKRAAQAVHVLTGSGTAVQEPAHDTLEQHQAVAALRSALAQLPAALVELYHLRVAGLSYEEMAAVVGAPVGTVKSRIHEMVGRLREEMKPWAAR